MQTASSSYVVRSQLLRHCVADDGKAQHSLASLRADLQAQLEKAQNQLRRMSFQKCAKHVKRA
eukprot:5177051-Pleurochrysis_carterae.AAC.1